MKRTFAAVSFVTLSLASFPALADVSVGSAGDWHVNIEAHVKIEGHSKQDAVKNGVGFLVMTKIENISNEEQTLHVWSCSYEDNWRSDNSLVQVTPTPCLKNYIGDEKLKPGQVYERELSVSVNSASPNAGDIISFRLGFTDGSYYHFDKDDHRSPRPVWSNPIVVKISD
jgi:hypothetical protein